MVAVSARVLVDKTGQFWIDGTPPRRQYWRWDGRYWRRTSRKAMKRALVGARNWITWCGMVNAHGRVR